MYWTLSTRRERAQAQHLRDEINILEIEKTKAKSHLLKLKRMIHELEDTLAQKTIALNLAKNF